MEKTPAGPERRVVLPCGEDCDGGCPYDDGCHYTDDDTDRLMEAAKAERAREQSRQEYRRKKERERVDPEYAARRKAQEAVRQKRYYEAHKETMRAKARERMKKGK